MYIEHKKDITLICQGLGKDAILFYHRFWGFVGVAHTTKANENEKTGICKVYGFISYQLTTTQFKRIVKEILGTTWNLKFTIDQINDDFIGCIAHININVNLKEYHYIKRLEE